jgi:hypothetical protein
MNSNDFILVNTSMRTSNYHTSCHILEYLQGIILQELKVRKSKGEYF